MKQYKYKNIFHCPNCFDIGIKRAYDRQIRGRPMILLSPQMVKFYKENPDIAPPAVKGVLEK